MIIKILYLRGKDLYHSICILFYVHVKIKRKINKSRNDDDFSCRKMVHLSNKNKRETIVFVSDHTFISKQSCAFIIKYKDESRKIN